MDMTQNFLKISKEEYFEYFRREDIYGELRITSSFINLVQEKYPDLLKQTVKADIVMYTDVKINDEKNTLKLY